jgi:hypothetical protein
MGDMIVSLICCIPQLLVAVIPFVIGYLKVLANTEKRKTLLKIILVSLNTTDKREHDVVLQKIIDDELEDQSSRSEKKSPGLVERLIAIIVAGVMLLAILKNPDSVGQFPDNWLSLLFVFAVSGVLIWWGLSSGSKRR